jgi:hypothetical protein
VTALLGASSSITELRPVPKNMATLEALFSASLPYITLNS